MEFDKPKSVSLNTHSDEVFIVEQEVSCSQKDICSRAKKNIHLKERIQNVAVPNTGSHTMLFREFIK